MPIFDPLPQAPATDELPLHLWEAEGFTVAPWPEGTWQTGYNSHTWLLERSGARVVLKAVPKAQAVKFASGLRAAELAEQAGIPAGAPRRTRAGDLVAEHGPWCWGLLEYVAGRPPEPGNPQDLARAGHTLGRIHAALRDIPPLPQTLVWPHLDWLLAEQPFLEGREWIQQAIREGLETAASENLSSGVIHCDPRLTEFRFEEDRAGLLDWGEVMHGPHVFDLAGTLSFLDEETDPATFLAGYLETSPAPACDFTSLPVMLKVRAATEGWIYASREYHGVDLGQSLEYSNAKLIERARDNVRAAGELPPDAYLP
ncbi:phosphotransferase enzyme family protein [Streptomyces axinellae]|jgi:Ser/Thr protein kinase RdoA (MazF antagonist)|uniref:Aminoglycoside phosphotransferase domain-containing protein n=1 Tax=Streptomyces axinellae TaxID=552788 RepID=A0ABP6CKV9_9ACTN